MNTVKRILVAEGTPAAVATGSAPDVQCQPGTLVVSPLFRGYVDVLRPVMLCLGHASEGLRW
jgi:hypothetical protein